MRKLLALTLLLSIQSHACTIDLGIKKQGAKTYYLKSGQTISKSIIKRLQSECKFNVRLLTKLEIKRVKITTLKKRLAKLQGGK